jgi:hypothetical protein
MIITTEHGTKFRINLQNKTWERIDKTGDSSNLRSESGVFNSILEGLSIGRHLVMICPPVTKGALGRMIITSCVVSIEEE